MVGEEMVEKLVGVEEVSCLQTVGEGDRLSN